MRLFPRWARLSTLVVGTLLLMSTACSAQPPAEGFAIYLTRDNVPPSQMEMLSHVELADEPIISMDDIVSYDASTHEMTLTANAIQRLEELHVPTSGTSFLVCVDKSPVYWGAFWVLYSSLSFDGVTIWLPLILDESPVVPIRRGYPWTFTDVLNDPRNNTQVFAALERAGKLTGTPQPEVVSLPASMKGYELYSWQYNDQWHFKLITGTNRNKMLEEVLSIKTTIEEDGLVHVYAVGVEQLKAALSLLPENEYIFWFSQFDGDSGVAIALPPRHIVDAITAHAAECGLQLAVAPR